MDICGEARFVFVGGFFFFSMFLGGGHPPTLGVFDVMGWLNVLVGENLVKAYLFTAAVSLPWIAHTGNGAYFFMDTLGYVFFVFSTFSYSQIIICPCRYVPI